MVEGILVKLVLGRGRSGHCLQVVCIRFGKGKQGLSTHA